MPAAFVIGSLVFQGISMLKANQAADDSAALSKSVARRNANIDIAKAEQDVLDTAANIRTARQEAAIYTSRQHTSYAASGVLADSGSPLAVQASSVGRMEQRIQQEFVNSGRRQAQMYDAAKAGIAYGDAQADAIKTANQAAMLRSGASMLSTAYGGYSSGVFSGGGAGAAAPNWSKFDQIDFIGKGGGFNY